MRINYKEMIPKDIEALKLFVKMIERRLTCLWLEYTNFVNNSAGIPRTSLIYPILFGEIELYEKALEVMRSQVPEHLLKELDYESLLPTW
jgi:hypothetical protein